MCPRKFTLKHVITNFPDLKKEDGRLEVHFGVPWRVAVERKNDFLAFYLCCEKDADATTPWTIGVDFEMRFISVTDYKYPEVHSHIFKERECWGMHNFHSWEDTLEGHMTFDKVVVECTVTIKEMTGVSVDRKIKFNERVEHLTDVVLNVEDKKFHVSKVVLSLQSPYFKTLFFGGFRESEKSEIEMKDVDPKEFEELLNMVYQQGEVTSTNVEPLLKMADQFDVELVREKCEQFLLTSEEVDRRTQFFLSDTYNLTTLKNKCLDLIQCCSDIRDYVPNNIADVSHETLVKIIENLVTQPL